MTKPVSPISELTEVRGIFAPAADHREIKALCKVDRNMLARMVDRGWSDGDFAEYLTANDIAAAWKILKVFGLIQPQAIQAKRTSAAKPSARALRRTASPKLIGSSKETLDE
jgi:hypothetical protein